MLGVEIAYLLERLTSVKIKHKGTGYSEKPGKVMMDLCGSDTSRCSNRLKNGP